MKGQPLGNLIGHLMEASEQKADNKAEHREG